MNFPVSESDLISRAISGRLGGGRCGGGGGGRGRRGGGGEDREGGGGKSEIGRERCTEYRR